MTPGWYGKIPATGDFLARRLPAAFSEAWDRWLQQAMGGSRERLGARWHDSYLSMPVWRFLLSPGMVTPNAWAGLMLPSVDAVGRQFPLTVAAALPPASLNLPATLLAAASWYDGLEEIALSAIAPRADIAAIDAAFAGRPFRREWLHHPQESAEAIVPLRSSHAQMLAVSPAQAGMIAVQLAEPCALWLCAESELFERRALLCERLPSAEQYCGMMEGRWQEHGWSRRDLRGAEAA
jgi:type VI secretion system protein ImpM